MKNKKINPENYEGYSYGPLKLERIGRVVRMSSHWEQKEFEEYKEKVKKERPNFKKAIDEKIIELIALVNQYEPLELLSTISVKNCFADPETYTESTYEGRECFVEFALSLILSQDRKKNMPHATKEAIDEFLKLVSEVMDNVLWYFGSEAAEAKRSKIEDEIRFSMLGRYLYIRGDSYPEHHIEMIREIFQPYNDFFKQYYGFECNELISIIQRISDQPAVNLHEYTEVIALMMEMHELFKKFVDAKGTDFFSSIEDMKKQYFALPEVQKKKAEFDKKSYLINKNLFEIAPTEHTPKKILDLLSSEFGDNASFVEVSGFKAWPTNDTIINTRPLIKDDGKYYCFLPQIVFRQMSDILEQMIQDKNENYYKNTYLKKRSQYLERKTLEYLGKLMPEARIFQNLYYNIQQNGKTTRVETDGLILFDMNLFIVEAKAGRLSVSSRRGGLMRLKDEIKKVLEEGFQQADRAKCYIKETAVPVFENEDGSVAVRLDDKDRYKNIYLINTTLQNFGSLASHMPTIKDLGYVKGTEWPWSVFINDLRVISEILDFPTLFLFYLQRRIRANDYPQFYAVDELDFLMFYLYEGLYFEDGRLKGVDRYIPHAYTEDLDRYYDYLAGRVSSGSKPRLKISEEYRKLVLELESTRKYEFTKVTTTLLDFDSETRHKIIDGITEAKKASEKDGRDHDLTMYFNDLNMGLMFSVGTNRRFDFWDNIDRHCKLKMYQTKFGEWILVTVDINKKNERFLDFRIYRQKWKYNPEMEQRLREFKTYKIAKFRQAGIKKIGRNGTCPCGSGLKYKKCCGE